MITKSAILTADQGRSPWTSPVVALALVAGEGHRIEAPKRELETVEVPADTARFEVRWGGLLAMIDRFGAWLHRPASTCQEERAESESEPERARLSGSAAQ